MPWNKTDKVVYVTSPLLDEKQIANALTGCANAQWYRAIVQIISLAQQKNLSDARKAVNDDNKTGVAGCVIAYDELCNLLDQLDGYAQRERPQD